MVVAESERSVRAQTAVDALVRAGATHVVWLVDTETSVLYEAMQAVEQAGRLKTVPVCREGEAIPLSLGLLLGGRKPVVIIQSTGFFESGDSLRGQAIDFGLPLVFIIGYRGWKADRSQMRETAAISIEPVLAAYGIPYHLLSGMNVAETIEGAFREAAERKGPVALLLPGEWSRAEEGLAVELVDTRFLGEIKA